MCEIADDHQNLIAEQIAEGVGGFASKKKSNIRDEFPVKQGVDWDAYFERQRKNIAPSEAARAAERIRQEVE
jgi:hypothetical protein